ncbi:MAG: PfkB family carbohydrate kinase [Terracidiphilus sp.]
MTRGIFVGLSTVDLIHTIDEFPPPDTKAVAQSQEVLVGGPATNAAITFSHLGGRATLISAVGNHQISGLIKEEVRRRKVGLVDMTPESEELPPISSVWVNQRGERNIVSVNTTRFNIPRARIDESILESNNILLVDGHPMEACHAWATAARSLGIPVVFDGGSWKPGTEKLLTSVDAAICSADFLPPGCTDEETVMQYLRTAGVRQVAITHGPNPVRFADGLQTGFIEVPQVDTIDTTGAGDIFHGAFCFHTASGSNFVDALREAISIAAVSCQFRGTRDWMSIR